jgi:hypothetical protein
MFREYTQCLLAWLRANIELIVFRTLRVLSRAYAFPPYVLGTLFPAPCPAPLQCALQQSSITQIDELILSTPSLQRCP